jgi:hypothetical protein
MKRWNKDIRHGASEFAAAVIRQCGVSQGVIEIIHELTVLAERAEVLAGVIATEEDPCP